VILDDKLVRSCVTKMSKVPEGAKVLTVEGVGNPDNLHPIQLAWIVHGGAQYVVLRRWQKSPAHWITARTLD
jgi:aldehyde oxidoreductase